MTAGSINIGNANTGVISISQAITAPTGSNLKLTNAAGMSPKLDGTEITMASGKTLNLTGVPSINIAISGTTVNTQYDQLKVVADIDITGKTLSLSGTYTPVAGNVFTIVDATSITGTFTGLADGAIITFKGRSLQIAYTATTVTLTDLGPYVTSNPSDTTVTAGNLATFTAAGTAPTAAPTVQWQVSTNGGTSYTDINGATNATYSFTAASADNGNKYQAVFTNIYGSATSTAATLTVNVAPAITAQPSNTTVVEGNTASFTATASGTPAPTVKWQVNTGSGWGDIVGATSTTYSFTTALSDNGNQYQAVFTNIAGSVNSSAATLTVNSACTPTTSSNSIAICPNQLPYSWNGLTFNAAGTQTAHLYNVGGCDSAATLNLSVSTSSASSISIISTATTICAGILVTFTATPVNGGTAPVYQWKLNGNNVGINSNVYTSTSLNNNDSVWCVLTSNSACATNANSTSNKLKVRVNANPVIASITNGIAAITTASLCTLGSTYRYYNATPYGLWSSDNAAVANVTGGSQAGVVTANSNGTATIKYTVSNTAGCSSSASLFVTVAQQATPNAITGNSVVCAGQTTTLSNTTPNGIWSSPNNRGTINATTGVYTGQNAGSGEARYTVTNAAGCNAFSSKTITVNAIPAVPTITYTTASNAIKNTFYINGKFCVGKSFTVVGIPNGGSWAYTNAAAGTITSGGLVTILGVGSGAIVYTYTDANGCSSSRTMSGNTAVCPGAKGVNTVDGQLSTVNDFTMYPNPAKGYINLNVEALVGAGSIIVTDLYGKTVKTQALSMGTNTIDIAKLSKGMYFVSTITNEGKTTKKLVVE